MSAVRYAAIVLDCDGVIFDTNEAKNEAFFEVARSHGYPEAEARKFAQWQRQNFGRSRHVAFDKLVSGAFGAHRFDSSVDELLTSFSTAVDDIYDSCDPTPGFDQILALAPLVPLFVASGSAQEQLRAVFKRKGYADYFTGVFGSPQPKNEILQAIAARVRTCGSDGEMLMIGDAQADADAALGASVEFAYMTKYSLVRESMMQRSRTDNFLVFSDLQEVARHVQTNGEIKESS